MISRRLHIREGRHVHISDKSHSTHSPARQAVYSSSRGHFVGSSVSPITEPSRLPIAPIPHSLFDAWLPKRAVPFYLSVGAIATTVWGLGYLLSVDKARLLELAEWHAQPLYVAAHLIAVRMFVSIYAKNFLAGTSRLEMPAENSRGIVERIFGLPGFIAALVIAQPLCLLDVQYLFNSEYAQIYALGLNGSLCAADYFLCGIWCLEWVLNTYIWVLLAVFPVVTVLALKRFQFKNPIDIVLFRKHYQPFLQMSSQGATVLLVFGAVCGWYVWYADGELSDYLGLGITAGLLLIGFAPPWLMLKSLVEKRVRGEQIRLQERLLTMRAANEPDAEQTKEIAALSARLDEAVDLLRLSYLDRLHRELGKSEAKSVVLKLLAPATTIVWKAVRRMLIV